MSKVLLPGKQITPFAESVEDNVFDTIFMLVWDEAGKQLASEGFPDVRKAVRAAREVSFKVALSRSKTRQEAARMVGVAPPTLTHYLREYDLDHL